MSRVLGNNSCGPITASGGGINPINYSFYLQWVCLSLVEHHHRPTERQKGNVVRLPKTKACVCRPCGCTGRGRGTVGSKGERGQGKELVSCDMLCAPLFFNWLWLASTHTLATSCWPGADRKRPGNSSLLIIESGPFLTLKFITSQRTDCFNGVIYLNWASKVTR